MSQPVISAALTLATDFFRYCANIPDASFVVPWTSELERLKPGIQTVRAGDLCCPSTGSLALPAICGCSDVATRFHQHVAPPQGEWLNEHVVHFTQRFREPSNYYAQSMTPGTCAETEH